MINAVSRGVRNYHESLHNQERPSALLASLYINSKRDPKKGRPLTWRDFCFYAPTESGESANSDNGSAMMLLAKKGLLPQWALFCFKEVTQNSDPDYIPSVLAFIAEDAILLHPVKDGAGYKGLLIAQESASNSLRSMTNPTTGEVVNLRIPEVHTKIIAEEGVTLFS